MNKKKLFGTLLAVAMLLLASCFGLTDTAPNTEDTQPSESLQLEIPTDALTNETAESTESATEPSETVPEETEEITEPTETQPEQTQAPTQPPQTDPPQTYPPQTEPPQTEPPQTEPPQTEPPAPTGSAAIIDAAYALGRGESLEGTHTLTGVITSIVDRYSSRYDNITVIISVPGSEDQPIQCFRLEGDGAEHLAVGDTITVTGTLMNYKGTIEFDAGCHLDSYVSLNPTEPEETEPVSTNNDDSKEYVANYIHTYGRLPDFYVTKNEAERLYGWSGGALDTYAPGMCIGGDTFRNYEGQLPDAPGRVWTECDIDTIGKSARGAKRIVFSNDGLVYYTDDHYETFELLYGEP